MLSSSCHNALPLTHILLSLCLSAIQLSFHIFPFDIKKTGKPFHQTLANLFTWSLFWINYSQSHRLHFTWRYAHNKTKIAHCQSEQNCTNPVWNFLFAIVYYCFIPLTTVGTVQDCKLLLLCVKYCLLPIKILLIFIKICIKLQYVGLRLKIEAFWA